MTAEKTPIDWLAIEMDYRAGIKPLRQMADEHGITHGAINKRAKRDCWNRTPCVKPKKLKVALEVKDEMDSSGFLYVIYVSNGVNRFYKIGIAKQFSSRFDQHQCSSPFEICVATCYFVGNMRLEERMLHTQFAEQRIRGEWFLLSAADLASIAQRALLV